MYLLLSFLLPGIAIALSLFLTIYNHCQLWFIILMTFLAWLIVFAGICVYILLALHFRGKKYAEIYDPKDKKRWCFMNNVSQFSCFWLGLHAKKVGMDKLKKDKTIVFYSNHRYFTDIILYDTVFKDVPRASMYKKEHDTNPIFGGMVRGLGGVSVDRGNDRAAIKSVIEIIKRVNEGVNFMVYPEGTRSKDGNVGEYHPGSFRIVEKAKDARLAIVAIAYSKIAPITFGFFPRRVYIELVEVLDKAQFSSMSTIELAKYAEDKTKEALDKARKKYKYLR